MRKKHPVWFTILFVTAFFICMAATPTLTIIDEFKPETISLMPASGSLVVSTPAPTPSPTPTPTPEPAFEEYDICFMALGDNLMHMGIVNSGKQEDGSYDYSMLFQNISEFLSAADLKAINQETILGGNRLGFSGYPRFNSPMEVGDAIVSSGFNIVLHATNHAADQGAQGMLNAIDYWQQHPEILMTGIREDAEEESYQTITVKGVTFAILNYTYGPNMGTIPKEYRDKLNMLCAYNESSGVIDFTTLNPKVPEDIEAAKEKADYVIVFPHWGTEYQKRQSSYQEKFATEMTQAGADIIIGTHPHVPQPIEIITSENGNSCLCYYSLGNYVSTQKEGLCMLEGMAWITFHVSENDVTINMEKTGVIPLVCHYNSEPVRFENVYLLEEYTEEQALNHGIRNYGNYNLRLDELQNWSTEIFDSWVLKKSDIINQ